MNILSDYPLSLIMFVIRERLRLKFEREFHREPLVRHAPFQLTWEADYLAFTVAAAAAIPLAEGYVDAMFWFAVSGLKGKI